MGHRLDRLRRSLLFALARAIQTRDLPTIAALEEAGAVEW
jgi:hypothetical protein